MDLQRANTWKRIAAWVLDLMLLGVLAVGSAWGLAVALNYDGYAQTVQAAYDRYELQYGIELDMDQATYDAMTPEEQTAYQETLDKIEEALNADEEVKHAYNMVVNLLLLIVSSGILVATLVLELIILLILKNGQTIGKKCFSLCVVRIDGVKVNNMQMFARTVLGKYTIEKMIPVYIIIMLLWGTMGLTGTLMLLILLVTQIICVAVGQNRAAIHDRLAGTVVVDIASQQIFDSTEDRIAYIKQIHEDQARKQTY